MRPRPTAASDSVIIDATGAGTASLGPSGCDWVITQTTVATNVTTATPTCLVYRGGVAQPNFVEGTDSGNGDASNTRHILVDGDRLYFVWSGATPGANATARVAGAQFPSGGALAAVQW